MPKKKTPHRIANVYNIHIIFDEYGERERLVYTTAKLYVLEQVTRAHIH